MLVLIRGVAWRGVACGWWPVLGWLQARGGEEGPPPGDPTDMLAKWAADTTCTYGEQFVPLPQRNDETQFTDELTGET